MPVARIPQFLAQSWASVVMEEFFVEKTAPREQVGRLGWAQIAPCPWEPQMIKQAQVLCSYLTNSIV